MKTKLWRGVVAWMCIGVAGGGCGESAETEDPNSITPGIVFEQQAYLKASNTDENDIFHNVALDGNTLVVGAPEEGSATRGVNGDDTNNDARESGAAYVFERAGDQWTQTAYLKTSNTFVGHQFGGSVAISGDTIVIGAAWEGTNGPVGGPPDPDSLSASGAVYVFERMGGAWTETAYLKASNARPDQHFGSSVATDGNTIAVGAALENSAYIFERSGGSWAETEMLPVSSGQSNANIGIEGDTLVVGAQAGVDVFERKGETWALAATLVASNSAPDDQFGRSVAIAAGTVVVGAPRESSNATGIDGDASNDDAPRSGAAYLFEKVADEWTQTTYIKASNTGGDEFFGDLFGSHVAIVDGRVVVGAPLESSNAIGVNQDQTNDDASASGAVYVFDRVDGQWMQTNYLKASNTEQEDFFGSSVAVSADTVAVGAPLESSSATGVDGDQSANDAPLSGAVYVFSGLPN